MATKSTSSVNVSMNSQEKRWLDDMADDDARTTSSMVRKLVRDAAAKRGWIHVDPVS